MVKKESCVAVGSDGVEFGDGNRHILEAAFVQQFPLAGCAIVNVLARAPRC